MGKIEKLEQQIRDLSEEELAQLRRWFAEFDAEVWDRQIEADAGGPARFLTLYTEGREAGLWAALVEPRVSEIELAPPILPPSAQEGAALLLALLANRSVIVHREALAPELLGQVQQSFKILGLEENLEVR